MLLLVKGAEDGSERATISELGRRLQLAQSTVTELVNRAAQAGLVSRGTSPDDGRVVYVQLTEEGDRRFAEAFQALAHERRALHDVVAKLEA
jgi:DNA-binding MarR family transcriptional regulator